jgi:DNA gyrase/topoisomerase IV subunit A
LESERVELESAIKYLKTVLEDPKVAWKEILDETSELKKKFATPRKSVIVKSDGALNDEDVRPVPFFLECIIFTIWLLLTFLLSLLSY